ncbi:protein TRM32 isoform X2 [Salvia miltiorrhiza]|nr:protein TRM32 isoform X2 [Salvia miltiorrhiza]
MKSRIKAFTDEVYKRKGRHRRSTSYPVRKPPDENLPSHQKGKSLDGVVPQNAVEGSHHSSDSSSHHHVRLNYLKQNEIDQLGDQPIRDHTLVHGNLIYAIEPSRGDALQESKLFMDALTLLNVREEMFLNILKDPSISLTNQLHCRRSPNLRYGLNKSMSFAASAPSIARDFDDLEASRRKHETRCEDDDTKESCEVLDNAASPAAAAANILRKKSDENRAGLIHFKNIRDKIKYVIRDRKKEKNRIMMDALHHKVPYGVSPSKKLAEDSSQPGWSDFGKTSIKEYKRTTSFDNSLDRYNQLLDTKDESKPSAHPSKPATLGRILSLPDIRSHIPDIRFNPSTETPLVSENRNQEQVKDESSADESSPEPMPSKSEVEQQAYVLDDSHREPSQDLIELDVPEEELVEESQMQQLYGELMKQEDAKNNAEFNYVRGVLELSGLTSNEGVVGEYPLNPSVFEEQHEYCCAPNQEEDGVSNQILLFDLINQVLLGIHERSFCYWPAPLTTRSTMHPLPKGSRVLEQVWREIKCLLSSAPQSDQDMDYAVTHDLSRNDGWMNLQLDAECVGLELEELIFDDLVDEILSL